jgi:hypothetical protein
VFLQDACSVGISAEIKSGFDLPLGTNGMATGLRAEMPQGGNDCNPVKVVIAVSNHRHTTRGSD